MSKEVKDAKDRKDLESFILLHLSTSTTIPDSLTFLPTTPFSHLPHSFLVSTLQSLASSSLIALTQLDHSVLTLTDEGALYATSGTPEGQLLSHLQSAGGAAPIKTIEAALGKETFDIGRGKAMKDKWITLDKDKGELHLKEGAKPHDTVKEWLLKVQQGNAAALTPDQTTELKKRKMTVMRSVGHSTQGRAEGREVGVL